MRLIMIALGALLLDRFEWIIYVFGGILIITGIRMMFQDEAMIDLEKNPVVRLARRILPVSNYYDGTKFFTRQRSGAVLATPLLLVLLIVEWSDLVFAIDSIPAIFAITRDPFLVYSSNIFAILGLRALFFVLAGMMDKFAYLKPGVAIILIFVGRQDDSEPLGPCADTGVARGHRGHPRGGGAAVAAPERPGVAAGRVAFASS